MSEADLARLFASFRRSAFRLECLPAYDVTEDAERERFRLWLAGEQPEEDRAWPELVATAVAAGKTMQRVRLAAEPLTAYLRFEMECGYPANERAGERIYILDHRPEGLLGVDFWLFDDETVVLLEYDDAGRFLRPVVAETLEPYRQARDMALKSSMPFHEYGARTGMRLEVFMQERLHDPAVMDEVARTALRGRTEKRG